MIMKTEHESNLTLTIIRNLEGFKSNKTKSCTNPNREILKDPMLNSVGL